MKLYHHVYMNGSRINLYTYIYTSKIIDMIKLLIAIKEKFNVQDVIIYILNKIFCFTHIHTYAHMHAHIHTHKHARTHVHICIYMHVYICKILLNYYLMQIENWIRISTVSHWSLSTFAYIEWIINWDQKRQREL